MATSAGEIEVKLTLNADDFKKGLQQGKSDASDFNSTIAAVGKTLLAAFSFGEIANFFRQSLTAYGEQEKAVSKLTVALRNQGLATQKTVDDLVAYDEALQQTLGVDNIAIMNAQALMVTFGLQGEQLKKTTQAVLDLSAATGVDLQRAAMLLGKAYEGETGALSRYGIIVNQHIDTSKKFAIVMDQVNSRFGGSAQAMAETYAGKVNIMKESFQDLMKSVGQLLSGPAGGFISWITSGIRELTTFLNYVGKTHSGFLGWVDIIGHGVITVFEQLAHAILMVLSAEMQLLSKIPLVGHAFLATKAAINSVDKEWMQNIKMVKAALDAVLLSEPKKQDAIKETGAVTYATVEATSQFTKDKMEEEMKLRVKYAAEEKTAQEEFYKGFVTTQADMWKFASDMRDKFFTGFGDSLAQTIVEGKSFGDAMKNVFRDMAEAIISYIIQMIAKLLVLLALETATGTGPAGGAAIGAIGGAFAEGGVINEPSIITGLRSGRKILAGENGPEMVSPMGSGLHTAAEMGGLPGSGGGGSGPNITINISGQFIEGNANSWNKLMREQIIPQIRRFTMVSATGPFNRTRGVV